MYCLADPISGLFFIWYRYSYQPDRYLDSHVRYPAGYSFCISNKSSYRLSGNRLLSSIYCIVYSFRNSYLYYNRYSFSRYGPEGVDAMKAAWERVSDERF